MIGNKIIIFGETHLHIDATHNINKSDANTAIYQYSCNKKWIDIAQMYTAKMNQNGEPFNHTSNISVINNEYYNNNCEPFNYTSNILIMSNK